MKLPSCVIFLLSMLFLSCDPPGGMANAPLEFQTNPEAQAAALRLTSGGTNLPSAAALDREINGHGLTERLHMPPCETCGVSATGEVTEGEEFTARSGENDLRGEEDRLSLVQQLREAGPDRHARTTLDLPGGRFEVFNDALTLPDGTYVNLTLRESLDIAAEWGCRLPNVDQAQAIRTYAEEQGNALSARPHSPNDSAQRYTNMNLMRNDPEMLRRAEMGRDRLINGHFKWYLDDGSDGHNFRFYGFRACNPYCQNRGRDGRGSSGNHGSNYIDYSQSARLICPAS